MTREQQRAKLLEEGYKLTGITDFDGRFEIVREPITADTPTVRRWVIWDYQQNEHLWFYELVRTNSKKAMLAQFAERTHEKVEAELKHETDRTVLSEKEFNKRHPVMRDSS